jgi:DNA mismatch repair protein MutS
VDTGTTRKKKKEHLDEVDLAQMSLFDTANDDTIIEELKNIDIGNLTPLDALNKLYELQNKVKNRW